MRKLGIVIGIIVVVIIVAVIALWALVDVNQYHGLVQAVEKARAGR